MSTPTIAFHPGPYDPDGEADTSHTELFPVTPNRGQLWTLETRVTPAPLKNNLVVPGIFSLDTISCVQGDEAFLQKCITTYCSLLSSNED